jgi:hypothetical protein
MSCWREVEVDAGACRVLEVRVDVRACEKRLMLSEAVVPSSGTNVQLEMAAARGSDDGDAFDLIDKGFVPGGVVRAHSSRGSRSVRRDTTSRVGALHYH